MNTGKIYKDIDGNERTIHQMVKLEPGWAASRIQQAEKYEEERQWQPIETAPKDGTRLIFGWWINFPMRRFVRDIGIAGNIDDPTAHRGAGHLHGQATHWQPLPFGPKEDATKTVAQLAAELADDPSVEMRVELNQVDDILAILEDTIKGSDGDKITKTRGLLQSYL